MYSLSLLWIYAFRCLVLLRQLEFYLITILTLLNLLSFFVALSLAVFEFASAFNKDVSKWNTGAVTDMSRSKCTLSPSLWPRPPLLCLLNIR